MAANELDLLARRVSQISPNGQPTTLALCVLWRRQSGRIGRNIQAARRFTGGVLSDLPR